MRRPVCTQEEGIGKKTIFTKIVRYATNVLCKKVRKVFKKVLTKLLYKGIQRLYFLTLTLDDLLVTYFLIIFPDVNI
jgi:hypothetical protein